MAHAAFMRLSLVWAAWPSGLICIVPGAQVVIGLIVALMPIIVDIWLHLVRFGFTASTMLFMDGCHILFVNWGLQKLSL